MVKMVKGSGLPPQRSGLEQTKVAAANIGDNVNIRITLNSVLMFMACHTGGCILKFK